MNKFFEITFNAFEFGGELILDCNTMYMEIDTAKKFCDILNKTADGGGGYIAWQEDSIEKRYDKNGEYENE